MRGHRGSSRLRSSSTKVERRDRRNGRDLAKRAVRRYLEILADIGPEQLEKPLARTDHFCRSPRGSHGQQRIGKTLAQPVTGRKNYYGCGSVWSGGLCAMLFTILQTCCINRIDPMKLLLAYFQACAENGDVCPKIRPPFYPGI